MKIYWARQDSARRHKMAGINNANDLINNLLKIELAEENKNTKEAADSKNKTKSKNFFLPLIAIGF